MHTKGVVQSSQPGMQHTPTPAISFAKIKFENLELIFTNSPINMTILTKLSRNTFIILIKKKITRLFTS